MTEPDSTDTQGKQDAPERIETFEQYQEAQRRWQAETAEHASEMLRQARAVRADSPASHKDQTQEPDAGPATAWGTATPDTQTDTTDGTQEAGTDSTAHQ